MITIETLRHFFAWCALINYAFLLAWLLIHLVAHSPLTAIALRLFGMPPEKYDSMTCKGMLYLKLSIWLFNIGPYIALRIIG